MLRAELFWEEGGRGVFLFHLPPDCGYGPAGDGGVFFSSSAGLRLRPGRGGGAFSFLALDCGCCPASGFGRLPAGGRGQGLAQPLAPYNPVPRVWAALLDGQHGYAGRPLVSSLPRGSGRSSSRCPALTRDERPSGVGASAPFGAAISSAPCPACVSKAESSSPLRKRYSVPCCGTGKTVFLLLIRRNKTTCTVQQKKTGQTSCRKRTCRRGGISSLDVEREKRLSSYLIWCAGGMGTAPRRA